MNETQKTLTTAYIEQVTNLLINGTEKEKAISKKVLTDKNEFVKNYNLFVSAMYES